MKLNTVSYDKTEDRAGVPPLLIAHGLFGSARNWGVLAKRLSAQRPIIAVDMRNHGHSPWADTHRYFDLAEDLAAVIAAQGTPLDVLGHSMGGKAAMVLAATHPALIRRLIVADIAPVAYAHTQQPVIDALRQVPHDKMSRRSLADAALAEHLDDPAVRAFALQSLDTRADPPTWRLNLDVLSADMPEIMGFPKVSAGFDGPTFILSGGASDYVLPAHRDPIKTLLPKARFAKIPGAGHWLHAEKPREFQAAIEVFLNT